MARVDRRKSAFKFGFKASTTSNFGIRDKRNSRFKIPRSPVMRVFL